MLGETGAHLVKTVHSFKGTNNDELCFKKGDIITVTQMLDGGWWEGTLSGVTGWFPSNYVKEFKQESIKGNKNIGNRQVENRSNRSENMKMYRNTVFKDILSTEGTHVHEIENLIQSYLSNLQQEKILNDKEYSTLSGNLEDILECHKMFHTALEEVEQRPSREQKIGGVFMQYAPQIKKVHLLYCANHPKAASVIEKHRETLNKFMEDKGATSPGILVLTTGLSRPFRRIEKYPALLQELQRYTEESHIDRGDTQRTIFIYREIASACSVTRRQKEMELEIMTGTIRDWEGEDIQTLGEILHMGPVITVTEDQQRKDRYLVLFTHTLVILSVSPRMSAFIYEGKLPLSGVKVGKVDSSEGYGHAFEITGSMIQRIIVICQNQESATLWYSLLHQQIRTSQFPGVKISPKGGQDVYGSPNHGNTQAGTTQSSSRTALSNDKIAFQSNNKTTFHSPNKVWTMWSLRPHPPVRPSPAMVTKNEVLLRRGSNRRKEKVFEDKAYEGDMKILQVIEAYCTSAKTRYTVNSALIDSPQVLIAEEEKIIVEEIRGDTTIVEERSLVDTVYALKDQVKELKVETAALAKSLDEEKKARKKLEALLKKHILTGREENINNITDD